MAFTSVPLQPDMVAAFDSFKGADLSHRSGLFGYDTVDVADCTSEEKWAIVDKVGRWGISHTNTIDLLEPVRFWQAPKWAPVSLNALTGGQGKGAKRRAMNALSAEASFLRIEAANRAKAAEQAAEETSKAEKPSPKANAEKEEVMTMEDLDWEMVEVKAMDEDYVLLE